MRAKPSAPATTPSCQSASAPARPISGSSGLKAPIEKQLHRLMKQSSAVPLKARASRSSPSGKRGWSHRGQRRREERPAMDHIGIDVHKIIEEDQIAPVRIVLELGRPAVHRPPPGRVAQERTGQPAGELSGHFEACLLY